MKRERDILTHHHHHQTSSSTMSNTTDLQRSFQQVSFDPALSTVGSSNSGSQPGSARLLGEVAVGSGTPATANAEQQAAASKTPNNSNNEGTNTSGDSKLDVKRQQQPTQQTRVWQRVLSAGSGGVGGGGCGGKSDETSRMSSCGGGADRGREPGKTTRNTNTSSSKDEHPLDAASLISKLFFG